MAEAGHNPYELLANRISEYVQAHLSEDIAIDDLSDLVGVSKYHLNRLFQVTTGFQLGEFIQRRRLQHAYSLLAKAECSVIEVSMAVGYESQSSFSRAFLKAFGCQPSEVKRGAVCSWRTPNTLKGNPRRDGGIHAEIVDLPSQCLLGFYGAGFKDNSFVASGAMLVKEIGARLHRHQVAPAAVRYVGVSLENPWQGDQNESRFFVGIAGQELPGDLDLEQYLWSAGTWARFVHRGSYGTMWQSIAKIYAGWVIPEGVLLKDDAIVQLYLNNPESTPQTDLCTALYFPLHG